MEDLKGKKVVTNETSNKDDREFSSRPPDLDFPPHNPKGKRSVVPWEIANKNIDREFSKPPGFRPLKINSCSMSETNKGKEKVLNIEAKDDREVSPPPGFPPRKKRLCSLNQAFYNSSIEPYSLIPIDTKKEEIIVRNDIANKDDRQISQPVGFRPPKPYSMIEAKKRKDKEICNNGAEGYADFEKEAVPPAIPSKRREKLTPISIIKRLIALKSSMQSFTHTTVPLSGPSMVTKEAGCSGSGKSTGDTYCDPRIEMIFAHIRLSLLLPIDVDDILDDPVKLKDIVDLATLLKGHTNMTADQVGKLKLIEDIPLLRRHKLEINELSRKVEELFDEIMSKCLKVAPLCKEFEKPKVELKTLQEEADLDADTLRGRLSGEINPLRTSARLSIFFWSALTKRKAMEHMESSLEGKRDGIQKAVDDIKVANAKKEECEMRMKLLIDTWDEARARFTPLDDFRLLSHFNLKLLLLV